MTIDLERRGILVVVSSPSGGGKTTVIYEVLKKVDNLEYSISATSRPPRPGEKHGNNYFFVSEAEFRRMIEDEKFYEWAWVHEHLYGTPKKPIIEKLSQGRDVIMDVDVQGALNIKRFFPESVHIFILPPSMNELEKRLSSRKQDTREEIDKRLENAIEEMSYAEKYDYLILNDTVVRAAAEIEIIITAERLRTTRQRISYDNEPKLKEVMKRLEEEAEAERE